jgi:hypothetical protein
MEGAVEPEDEVEGREGGRVEGRGGGREDGREDAESKMALDDQGVRESRPESAGRDA